MAMDRHSRRTISASRSASRVRSRSPLNRSDSGRRLLRRSASPRTTGRSTPRRRSPARSSSRRGLRRTSYRRSSSGSSGRESSSSSARFARMREAFEMQKITERLAEVERVNAKLEKKAKDKEYKFTKIGCENQFKFNNKIKEICAEKMRVELKKHFKDGLPQKIEDLIKEGEKEIDDENHNLKVADEFGFKAVEDFTKEDLARDDKEEKKIKALRKEKRGREEKYRSLWGGRAGRSGFRGFRGGHRGFYGGFGGAYGGSYGGSFGGAYRDREFEGDRGVKRDDKAKQGKGVKCYNCQGFGHMARECTKPQSGDKGRK